MTRHAIIPTPVPERQTWTWLTAAPAEPWPERVRELLNGAPKPTILAALAALIGRKL